MSIFGVTKGTEVEEQIDKNGKGEEQGVGMYAVLSYLDKERGLEEAAKQFDATAMDEGNHGEILEDLIEKFSN
jgi:rubrerythrin